MNFTINLADREAIRDTYGDCHRWRAKGGILRKATPSDFKPFDPARLIPEGEWNTLLELGCGLERWIKGVAAKASKDARVYACDLNRDVLRLFSREFVFFSREFVENWSEGRARHRCVLADGEQLPFVSNSFDGISAVFVGHHMKDAETFVSGLAKVLKPNGWLLTNSLDWNFPYPDFPSQGLQKLLREPAQFIVQNAFDETSARKALDNSFGEVREERISIPATLRSVDDVLRLHSRLEFFIKRVLPPRYEWSEYMSCVQEIAQEYFRRGNGSYFMRLPITYFIGRRPRTLVV